MNSAIFQIPLTISRVSSNKKVITVKELVNLTILDKIISSNKVKIEEWIEDEWGSKPYFENELAQLQAYRKKFKKSNIIVVNYNLTSKSGLGRVYPEKSLSLCQIRREVRHTLCKNIYADIDIRNCHPVLLEQICATNGISTPFLTEYIRNRDTIISHDMSYYNCTKEDIKDLYIRLLFFGGYQPWANKRNIEKEETPFIREFTKELKKISKIIIGNNQELFEFVKKTKKNKNNIEGSVVSLYLQEWERRILECIYEFMIHMNILTRDDPVVLCFDGIMIPIDKYSEELLILLKQVVNERLHFNVDFLRKEMNEDFISELGIEEEMPDDNTILSVESTITPIEEPEIEEIIDESKLSYFDSVYFSSLLTYKGKKKYFENFVVKIRNPPCYIYSEEERVSNPQENEESIKKSKNFTIYNENDLIKSYREFHFLHQEKQKSFINTWLNDTNLKSCNNMDFLPMNTSDIPESRDFFNLFGGYSTHIHNSYDQSKSEKILSQFMRIGRELCGGNQEHFNYLLHYFAHMIQKPAERIPICIIIKGNQGVGKNVWLNAIGNILNKKNYITTANPRDLFGEYAEGFYHKLLVNLNECEGRETFDFEGRIKSFITEDSITINAKYQRPISISNYARLIIFSNKATPISIDVKSGDRRYVVFQTTDEMLNIKNRDNYWKLAVEHFKKPEFIACLYNYLNTLNVEGFNFIKNRPITQAYREMCKMFIPTEALFFEDFIDECKFDEDNDVCLFPDAEIEDGIPMRLKSPNYKKDFQIVGSQLYVKYTQWAKSKGFHREYSPSIKQFYGKLVELNLPIEKFKSSESRLRFKPSDVYSYLIRRKWIVGADGEEVIEEETIKEEEETHEDLFDI
jgi:hypothetical protein